MNFKKSLFLTFCLLFGASQTVHTISWQGIKKGARNAANMALIKTGKRASVAIEEIIICTLVKSLISFYGVGLCGLCSGNDIDDRLLESILTATKFSLLLSALAECATYCAGSYLKSKSESISEKIKNGSELSDNEISFFIQALTDKEDAYFRCPPTLNDDPLNSSNNQLKTLRDEEHLISAINNLQLNSNSEVINAILEYTLNKKTLFSYAFFRALLPFAEQHGAEQENSEILIAQIKKIMKKQTLFEKIKAAITNNTNTNLLYNE